MYIVIPLLEEDEKAYKKAVDLVKLGWVLGIGGSVGSSSKILQAEHLDFLQEYVLMKSMLICLHLFSLLVLSMIHVLSQILNY